MDGKLRRGPGQRSERGFKLRPASELPQTVTMLPTPAPSSPGGTLHDDDDDQHDEDDVVIDVPENKGTYPDFQVLCLLLERLARERKQDTRRRLLTKWFSVRVLVML